MTTIQTPRLRVDGPPQPIRAAVWCVVAVVVLGLASAALIFANGWPGWTDTALIIIGQSVTVLVPGLLTIGIWRGVNKARWSYFGLVVIGTILRASGLADSVSTASTVNATLQATSIAASLCSVILLLTPAAQSYFRACSARTPTYEVGPVSTTLESEADATAEYEATDRVV